MNNRVLILEDNDERIKQFKKNFLNVDITFTKIAEECIEILENNKKFDYIFLDHDLGGKEMLKSGDGTGYEVAKWLEANPSKIPKGKIYCHSLNPAGALNISLATGAERLPFIWLNKLDFNG